MYKQESEVLEFKSSFGEWKEIIISLAAFANKNGGKVVVGIKDDGSPTNVQMGRKTIEDFVNKLKSNTDPVLYPAIDIKSFALGEIVEIEVHASDYKPVFAFHRAYSRVGKTNIQLSSNEIKSLVQKFDLPDFDQIVRKKVPQSVLDEKIVKDLQYEFSSNKVTNAEYLCFARQPLDFHCAISKAGLFKGEDMASILDTKDFSSNLLQQSEDILNYIKQKISMEVVISGESKRQEIWQYPLDALRESVNNALVHRDYQDAGNIQVRIFDDRLEIWSPGLLPKELDINQLPQSSRSIPRNRHIARIFYEAAIIENWGSGFGRVLQACKQNNNPAPEWKQISGAFVTTYYKHEGVSEGVSEGVNKEKDNKTPNIGKEPIKEREISEGVSERVSEGVNQEVRGDEINKGLNTLIKLISENPGMRAPQIAESLSVPLKTIERWLSQLKGQGKIIFAGGPKTGGYFSRKRRSN